MRIHCLIIFYSCLLTSSYAQQMDVDFSRNGLLIFKELGMDSSHLIDFEVISEDRINALYESNAKRNLVRFHKNGAKDIQFSITASSLNNENTIPVAISSKSDGSVLVLSNLWNGHSWMISINEFFENGNVNQGFGSGGVYKRNILNNYDDNYGQYMYVSPKDNIIVVSKVCQFNMVRETEKVAVLKVSQQGETLSSKIYKDNYFTLNCSAMRDDKLLVAYSESLDNGAEQATYLVGFSSDEMTSSNLDCITIDSEYKSFDQLAISNSKIYASNIQNDLDNLYTIRKYNSDGNIDESFKNLEEINFNADIYSTDFVVNDLGEVFIVSMSLENEQEILITKLSDTGKVDTSFGSDGVATIFFKYPILDLTKIQLDDTGSLYISGAMSIEGSSFGFITKLKLNVRKLKKEQLEKFLNQLFKKE